MSIQLYNLTINYSKEELYRIWQFYRKGPRPNSQARKIAVEALRKYRK